MNGARGAAMVAVAILYLTYVFQLADAGFWTAGIGYWLDGYFINGLLEHWLVSLRRLNDPSSPPMYFPVPYTLGYSHGLILFVPFYVPLRLLLHPFQAHNWTILLAIGAGIVCLYALFRRVGLSRFEALVMVALFATSRNVINEPMSAWTQRVSVFLIPPLLLMLLASARMQERRSRIALAGLAGFLATLMYVQDFYTAHLALFIAVAFAGPAFLIDGHLRRLAGVVRDTWEAQTAASWIVLVMAAMAAGWAAVVWFHGGGRMFVLGVEISSHDWRRPASIALVAAIAFVSSNARLLTTRDARWCVFVVAGAAAGALVFLSIYVTAYLEHRSFPEEHLLGQLRTLEASTWTAPSTALQAVKVYDTWRPFLVVLLLAAVAWVPAARARRAARAYSLWLVGVSALVVVMPLRFGDFSIWRTLIEPLPGFGVIRDPKRIVYLYELGVAIAAALFISRLRERSVTRLLVTLILAGLVVLERPDPLRYHRPMADFDRWVAASVAIDPSCRSFYVARASDDYMARFDDMWGLYNIDALFVSLARGIPTLNGYSAWYPAGWQLHRPQESGYNEAVTQWIARHGLQNVCELDIDARRMTRREP
jgi:hypothetical protein